MSSKIFAGCTVLPDSTVVQEVVELRSSNKEASSSASKNTWVVLMLCPAWKLVPRTIRSSADILDCPWVTTSSSLVTFLRFTLKVHQKSYSNNLNIEGT